MACVTDHSCVGISLLDCYLWMNCPELCTLSLSSALMCLQHFGASVILIHETIRTSVDSLVSGLVLCLLESRSNSQSATLNSV